MSTCPWWCLSATRPRSPDVAARADDARVSVFYLFFGLNHCAQARPHIPQYDYRRVREARIRLNKDVDLTLTKC